MSSIDWRANRLADAAAKAAALEVRVSATDRIRYRRVVAAYEHALAELGIVTTAANRHKTEVIDDDGKVRSVYLRDSAPLPRCQRPRLPKHAPSVDPVLTSTILEPARDIDFPLPEAHSGSHNSKRIASPARPSLARKRRRMERDHAAICEAHQAGAWRSNRDARSFTPVCAAQGSAHDRLSAVLQRIRSRSATS